MKNRETFLLEIGWRFKKGSQDSLPATRTHTDMYNFSKAGGHKGPADPKFSDHDWKIVKLPHDWVSYEPFDKMQPYSQGYKHRGDAWYRIQFQLEPKDREKQILLEFDGIASHSEIYINGTLAKRNYCGYTSFEVDITDFVTFGPQINTLAVKVNADIWEGWWYEGAGIYREVRLIKKSPVHIAYDGIWADAQKISARQWEVQCELTLENSFASEKSCTITTELKAPDGEVIASSTQQTYLSGYQITKVNHIIPVHDPKLWDVNSPHLYQANISVTDYNGNVDTDSVMFGFRTLRVDAETGFYLNERPLKLKGTCNHQDHAGVGVAVPAAVEEYRIRRLKEMGCNAYRAAHGNPSRSLLDLCDRYGILVMDENRNFISTQDGIAQIRSMVLRDRNHPCVIMYSVFNEEPLQGTPQGRRIAEHLKAVIQELDHTRPLLGAMNGGFMSEKGCGNVFDITGFNYFIDSYEEFHAKYPQQPIVGSETNSCFADRGVYYTDSSACLFDNYDEQRAPWGDTVRETWKSAAERPYVMGMFAWTGFDYRGEPSPSEWPSISSHFGIMDTCGFPKDAYYLYQAYWLNRPVLHILPHWNFPGKEGNKIRVMTYSNCDEIELFINGTSCGRQKNALYEQCSWMVIYQPGTLEAVGYHHGNAVIFEKVETTGAPCKLVLTCEKTSVNCDGQDAAVIDVYTIDSNGRFVPTAENLVNFHVRGGANDIGVGNGNPNCHEPDRASQRSLFQGKCQLIVQSNFLSEDIIVTASSAGIDSAEIKLAVTHHPSLPYLEPSKDTVITNWRMSHEASLSKPDPSVVLASCDMNTFEPVQFDGTNQPQLDDRYGYYAEYKTIILKQEIFQAKSIYFNKIIGYAWIYFDGKLMMEKDCLYGDSVEVKLPSEINDKLELSVIVQCNNKALPFGGISDPVVLKF